MDIKENFWVIESKNVEVSAKYIANEFLLKKLNEGRSPNTIYQYKRTLLRFLTECSKKLEDLTENDVYLWLFKNYSTKKSRTVNTYFTLLSNFLTYCNNKCYINKKLIKKRWRPKNGKLLPKYICKEELAKLKIHMETIPLRDQALTELLLTSGCRRSEAHNLDVIDVNFQNESASVIGKNNKTRTIHFSKECAALLGKYLSERQSHTGPLFLNKFGKRLSSKGVYRIAIALGKRAGLAGNTYPHRFRHTFATRLISKGADLIFLADELGHENLDTTCIYVEVLTSTLIAEYKKRMEYL